MSKYDTKANEEDLMNNFKLPFDKEHIIEDNEFLVDIAKSFCFAIVLILVTGVVGWLAADVLYRLAMLAV